MIDTSNIYSIQAEFDNVCFGWEMQRGEEGSARQRANDKECQYIARLITEAKCHLDVAVWHYERRSGGHVDRDDKGNYQRKKECSIAVKNLIEQINKLDKGGNNG